MENQNLNILDEINKGATMGMNAVSYISDKNSDPEFGRILDDTYQKYQKVSSEINRIYPKYSSKEPHETNAFSKMMNWYGIQMKTLTDDTTSKLSELLMQGTNMGIIEGRRLINQNPHAEESIKNILHEFVTMQEKSLETFKTYL